MTNRMIPAGLRRLAALACAALAISAAPLLAGGEEGGGPPSPQHRPEGGRPHAILKEKLGLDEQQVQAVKAAREEAEQERAALGKRMEALAAELRRLQEQDNPDEARMVEIGREMGGLRVEMGLVHRRSLEKLKASLSPEQVEKFKEMRENMMERRGGGPEGRPRWAPGAQGPREGGPERLHRGKESKEGKRAEAKTEGRERSAAPPREPEDAE